MLRLDAGHGTLQVTSLPVNNKAKCALERHIFRANLPAEHSTASPGPEAEAPLGANKSPSVPKC